MVRSHQAKAMSLKWNQIDYIRIVHTKRKRKRIHLNGVQSHSSESDIAFVFTFAFARWERSIKYKIKMAD